MTAVPLSAYLIVGAILFAIGLYAILAQRTAVMVLMGVECLLNAVGLNFIAFWRYAAPTDYAGQIAAILVITVGAIEMAIGLGILMMLYRQRQTVEVDQYMELHE